MANLVKVNKIGFCSKLVALIEVMADISSRKDQL